MNRHTQRLAFAALILALSIISRPVSQHYILLFGSKALRFDFITIVLIIYAGLTLGPGYGAIVGALADLIGANLFPAGPFYIGFTLSSTLAGFLPGLVGLLYHPRLKRIEQFILPGLTALILLLTTMFLIANVGLKLFSNPVIILTWGLSGLFILGLILYFSGVILFARHLDQGPKQDPETDLEVNAVPRTKKTQAAAVSVLVVVYFVNILLTPLWIQQMYGVPYAFSIAVRFFLYLPFSLIQIFFLSALLRLPIERLK